MSGESGLEPLAPAHAAVAAALHAAAMAAGTGDEAWDADAIRTLIALPGSFGWLAHAGQDELAGFVLARVAADEAEILTLAVAPARQGAGIGRGLMAAALCGARAAGASRMLLEVATDNAPARALYARLGFAPVGCRRAYYRRPGRPAEDCLVMALGLQG